ncbi:MAG: ATPase [Campylobacterota bacterium]|nr:ATPase [Campylobacterota bacterium]
MIERFYLKDLLSFKELELNFSKGLIVFTGPSGSGKSLLMDSILATLGLSDAKATLSELDVNWSIDEERYGFESFESNSFRQIKKEKVRYFVNSQSSSKKTLKELSLQNLKHLSLKDYSDFENRNLLALIDNFAIQANAEHKIVLKEYVASYREHKYVSQELETLLAEQKKIVELKEFAAFEVDKIAQIDPKEGEDEELLEIKKSLSKKEKIEEQIQLADALFNHEHEVSEALNLIDVESAFFDDTMNELRAHFDSARERLNNLDDMDIESLLDRIEALSSLKRRYGSIGEAILYQEQKMQELNKYVNINTNIEQLQHKSDALYLHVKELAHSISQNRNRVLASFEQRLNYYLKMLYLRDASLEFCDIEYSDLGKDELLLKLNGTILNNISTGEFNRLRLAILAIKSEFMGDNSGVLMLDEIDANLSGEESMSVAKVLRKLSSNFQIFVISHQPQLTSMGDEHFLIYKEDDESRVKKLNELQREDEIARMISGSSISTEARSFAKELLESAQCAS